MTKDDFDVLPSGTHRTLDLNYVRIKAMSDKIDAVLKEFEYHHEFMAGGVPHGET